jgi:hypothetical protein
MIYCWNGQDDAGQAMPDEWFDDGVDFTLGALADPDAQVLAHFTWASRMAVTTSAVASRIMSCLEPHRGSGTPGTLSTDAAILASAADPRSTPHRRPSRLGAVTSRTSSDLVLRKVEAVRRMPTPCFRVGSHRPNSSGLGCGGSAAAQDVRADR